MAPYLHKFRNMRYGRGLDQRNFALNKGEWGESGENVYKGGILRWGGSENDGVKRVPIYTECS